MRLNNINGKWLSKGAMLTMVCGLSLASCQDQLELQTDTPDGNEPFVGEMIQFAAGTTANSITSRAETAPQGEGDEGISVTPGKTYYMPKDYRFVCRMFYKAKANSDEFDYEGGTDVTAWLKVDDKGLGNSLYWNNGYNAASGTDDYGNDKNSTHFYWQNRKEHAFLAWFDLNKATSNRYSSEQKKGWLKFYPEDYIYEKHTGEFDTSWRLSYYGMYGTNVKFESPEDFRYWLETVDPKTKNKNYASIAGKVPEGIEDSEFDNGVEYKEKYLVVKFHYHQNFGKKIIDSLHYVNQWLRYQLYGGATELDKNNFPSDRYYTTTSGGFPYKVRERETNKCVARIKYDKADPQNTAKWKYLDVDDDGYIKYREDT
ncbi:MAG: hypothetical protein Q4B68_11290, partial [Bacteroidales bacterium]|nr:hypothetical protein [Bacteroidales bacterium]